MWFDSLAHPFTHSQFGTLFSHSTDPLRAGALHRRLQPVLHLAAGARPRRLRPGCQRVQLTQVPQALLRRPQVQPVQQEGVLQECHPGLPHQLCSVLCRTRYVSQRRQAGYFKIMVTLPMLPTFGGFHTWRTRFFLLFDPPWPCQRHCIGIRISPVCDWMCFSNWLGKVFTHQAKRKQTKTAVPVWPICTFLSCVEKHI